MDQNQVTTGTEPVGDAAPQTVIQAAPQPPAPATPEPATPPVPTETEAERGLRQGIEAERKKRQETEAQLAQSQMAIAQLVNRIQQSQQPAAPAEVDPIGLSESDLLDPAKVRQGMLKIRQDAMQATQQAVAELQFKMQYPDFDQLVGMPDPATAHLPPPYQRFVYSEILQEAINEDPSLPAKASQSGNPRLFAYEVARRQKQIRELRKTAAAQVQQQQQQQDAARHAAQTADALTAPMSPSAVSGAPAQSTEVDAMQLLKTNPKAFDDLVQSIARGKFG